MWRVQVLFVWQDESVPEDSHHARQGPLAGRHVALHVQGPVDFPLYGLLDVLRVHGGRRHFGRRDSSRRCARQGRSPRLRHHYRLWRSCEDGRRDAKEHRWHLGVRKSNCATVSLLPLLYVFGINKQKCRRVVSAELVPVSRQYFYFLVKFLLCVQ
jgi:hypothetical protein